MPTPPVSPLSVRQQLRALRKRTGLSGAGTRGRRVKPPVAAFSGSPWLPKTALTVTAQQLLSTIPRSQFVLPTGKSWKDVGQLPGHLDLFSGAKGFARSLANTTGRWVLTFDICHDPSENLLDEKVQNLLSQLVAANAFISVSAGPVCSSFSRAVRPAVRSSTEPRGFSNLSASMTTKVREGNQMSVSIIHSSMSCCKTDVVGGESIRQLFMASTGVERVTGIGRCCLPQH